MEQLGLSDLVPVLRADLKIGDPQPGRGESEIHVEDPSTGKFLVMKGFELSLARMLNGRRTAEEVLTAAGQIGLPLSIESLNGFLRKLNKEGFLHQMPGMAPVDITTWEARSEWNEEIRRLFQEALREARADRFVAAKSRLDALLARSPATKEAQQLLHWVMERLRPASGPKTPAFSDVYAMVEKSWFADGERTSAANEQAAATGAASFNDPTEQADPNWRPPGKSKLPLVIGALAVAGVVGGLFVPFPSTAKAPFTLAPRSVTNVAVARAGTLATVAVRDGQWVDKGTTIATWDTAAAQKKINVLEAKAAEVAKKNKASAAQAKKAADAQAKLDKAVAALAKATADVEKAKAASKGKKTPAVAKLEKKLAPAQKAVKAAEKAVAAAGPGAAPGIQGELKMIEDELKKAKAELTEINVVAGADGFVQGLAAKPGQAVDAGAVLLKLEDSRVMQVTIALPRGEAPAVGAKVSLTAGTITAKAVIEKVEAGSAIGTLDNTNGGFKGGTTGESSFPGAPKSVLGRL